jgi:Trypsin-like peptidase domain
MNWSSLVSKITPFVVRIQTKDKFGTGFIFWQNETYCCIATAKHVISDANEPGWEQPILIIQPNGNSIRFYPDLRNIKQSEDESGDSAAILVYKSGLVIPDSCLPLWNWSLIPPIGTEVGWLGYPALIHHTQLQPSFFSGIISNVFTELSQFMIDGVSIHGVSGGPVFCCSGDEMPRVIGTISSYFANRVYVSGSIEAWPGLALSHDFSVFQPVIDDLESLNKSEHINTPT